MISSTGYYPYERLIKESIFIVMRESCHVFYLKSRIQIGQKYVSDVVSTSRIVGRNHWFHIMSASLAYITAHIFDYFLTVYGITADLSQEANPVVRGYMEFFGVGRGLVICKSLMCIIIILGTIVAHLACREKGNKIRVELILYAGSLMTLLGGALWLTRL